MTVILRIASFKKGTTNGWRWLNNSIWMFFCGLFLLSFDAHAQTTDWKWVVGAGTDDDHMDEAHAVALDQDGNIYITGCFRYSGVFGDTTLTFEGNGPHFFISKLDKDGNWLWTQGAESSSARPHAASVDDDGNLYIAGYYYQEIVLGDTRHTGPRQLGFDLFVAKLDKDGNWIWSRSARGEESLSRVIYDLALDNSGNIYVTGFFDGRLDLGNIILEDTRPGMNYSSENLFVAKMDTAGRWISARVAGTERDQFVRGHGIAADNEDNIYVTGFFKQSIQLDTIILNSGDSRERAFLARMNKNREWDWAIYDQGVGVSQALSIDLDKDANVYITGTIVETAIFGDQELKTEHWRNHQIFIAKADSSGNWLWAKQAGGSGTNQGLDVFVSEEQYVYLTGFFQGRNSPFGEIILEGGVREMIFTAKLDEYGNWLMADLAGSERSNSRGYGLVVDRDENIHITGRAGMNASFGDLELPGFGDQSVFLAKMEFADSKTTPAEYVMELPSGYELHQNYPNPFNPSTTFEFSLPEAGMATLTVHDILGQHIATLVSGELKAGKHTYHWDSAGLASGLYLYRLRAGNVSQTRKMQIVK